MGIHEFVLNINIERTWITSFWQNNKELKWLIPSLIITLEVDSAIFKFLAASSLMHI